MFYTLFKKKTKHFLIAYVHTHTHTYIHTYIQRHLQKYCLLFYFVCTQYQRQMVGWQQSLNLPTSILLHVVSAWQMAAEGWSDTMVFDMEMWVKQRCGIEFLHVEKIVPTDIHRCLLNVSGDQTVDMSTVRWWAMCFSSGNSGVKGKPCYKWPCTAVTPQNEEHLNQLSQWWQWQCSSVTCRFLQAQHAGSCSSLVKMHNYCW